MRSGHIGSHEDMDLDYHGDIRFYAGKKELCIVEGDENGLADYKARFIHGDLEWIQKVE